MASIAPSPSQGLRVASLPQILQGKKLYWNEYGVGGGTSQNGNVKATTAAEAAQYPFFGVFGQYTRDNDPWQLYDANNAPPTRQYLNYFYNQTIAYLNSGGVSAQLLPSLVLHADGACQHYPQHGGIGRIMPVAHCLLSALRAQYCCPAFKVSLQTLIMLPP